MIIFKSLWKLSDSFVIPITATHHHRTLTFRCHHRTRRHHHEPTTLTIPTTLTTPTTTPPSTTEPTTTTTKPTTTLVVRRTLAGVLVRWTRHRRGGGAPDPSPAW